MELVIINRKKEKFSVFFDDSDEQLVRSYRWYVTRNSKSGHLCYVLGSPIGGGQRISMHRLFLNPSDSNLVVDHVNGNGLDNRRVNLRVATKSQNAWNTLHKDSHCKGLSFYKGRWRVQLDFEGIRVSLGRHDTHDQAAAAYEKVASKLFGEFYRPAKTG